MSNTYYLNQAVFAGGLLVWDVMFVIINLILFFTGGAIISLVAAIILAALGVWQFFTLKRLYKEAAVKGLMTRSEHKLEQYHEAQLQSIWESK